MTGKIIIHEDPTSDALMFEVAQPFRRHGRAAEIVNAMCAHAEAAAERDRLRELVAIVRRALPEIARCDDHTLRAELVANVTLHGRRLAP